MTYTIAGTQHIGVAAGSTIMVFALPALTVMLDAAAQATIRRA